MKRTFALLGLLVFACALTGCEPQDSLFPLYTKSDLVYDQQLVGEWYVKNASEEPREPPEKPGLIIFSPGARENSYDVKMPEWDKDGSALYSVARILKLGNYMFVDFQMPDSDKFEKILYPAIEAHIFGRINIGKDEARIDFLNDEWVTKQAKEGKLSIRSVKGPNGRLLSANTDELKQFALEHAEDHQAFSESYLFARKK